MSNKVFFISLGCDKNRVDSEIMLNLLEEDGFEITKDPAFADCAVINTCGFIEVAKKEAVENIFDMVRVKQDEKTNLKVIVVTGCVAQRYKDEVLEQIPEVDAAIGLSENHDIVNVVKKALSGERYGKFDVPEKLIIEGERKLSTPKHFAYLKIAEGCDNRCTYCAIPSIRGRYRSRPFEKIIAEARKLVASGVKELILVAQDTTAYGKDLENGENLSTLLTELDKIDELKWIRVLYTYPDNLDDELIETMASTKKFARYIDLPLQHCSGSVLKRMGRFGDRKTLYNLINKLREKIDGITIRTTFIVGFPGETKEDFNELLEFAKEIGFDRAGCFEFSEEEGTPAVKLLPKIEESEKAKRADIFMRKQSEIMFEKQQHRVGKTETVVCDGQYNEEGFYICRAQSDTPEVDSVVFVKSEREIKSGEFLDVTITKAELYDVFGEV